MNTRRRLVTHPAAFVALGTLLLFSDTSRAQSPSEMTDEPSSEVAGDFLDIDAIDDVADISLEELLMVTTTTKRASALSKSPATISVITAEDIRRLGVVHFNELLARVAGVMTLKIGKAQRPMTSRNVPVFSDPTVLVLIDGRTANVDSTGSFFGASLEVVIDEIKQIEVIKGPGAALYGDHALHMVINVVTYSAEEIDGTIFRTRLSMEKDDPSTFTSVVTGKRFDNGLDFKVAASYTGLHEWQDGDYASDITDDRIGDMTALRSLNGSAQLGYAIADDHHIGARFQVQDQLSDAGIEGRRAGDFSAQLMTGRLDWNLGDLSVMAWARYGDTGSRSFTTEAPSAAKFLVVATEANYLFAFDELRLSGIVGAEIKGQGIDSTMVRESPFDIDSSNSIGPLMQYSPFVQAEYQPFEEIDLSLSAGGRFDVSDLGGNKLSVKSSLVYTPVEEAEQAHTFYFSFSPLLTQLARKLDADENNLTIATGYTNPTLLEVYGLIPVDSVTTRGIPMTFYFVGPGGENNTLKPERIDYWELGYRGRYEDIRLNVDLFVYKQENIIYNEPSTPQYLGQSDGTVHLGLSPYINLDEGQGGAGGETELRYSPTSWVSMYANYAYLSLRAYDLDRVAPVNNVNLLRDDNLGAPMHQVGGGFFFASNSGMEFNVDGRWVDGYQIQGLNENQVKEVYSFSSHTTLSARLGQRFLDDAADLSLFVYNVLDPLQAKVSRDDSGAPLKVQPGSEMLTGSKPEAGVFVNFTLRM